MAIKNIALPNGNNYELGAKGSNVTLDNYSKTTGNVSTGDSVGTAIGKLETKADTNKTNVELLQALFSTCFVVSPPYHVINGSAHGVSVHYEFKANMNPITKLNIDFTVSEFGLIYSRDGTVSDFRNLTLDNVDGTHIIKSVNVNGSNIVDNGYGVLCVGYVIITLSNNTTFTVYTNEDIGGVALELPTTVPSVASNSSQLTSISSKLSVASKEDRAALVEVVDNGAKNVFIVGFTSKAATSTLPAITNNGDGTVTANGSRSLSEAGIWLYDMQESVNATSSTRHTLPAGDYVLTPTGNSKIAITIIKHDGTNIVSLGSSTVEPLYFTYTAEDKITYPYLTFRLVCGGNAVIDNYTFTPMICTKAAWDISHEYVPHRPSEDEQNERISSLLNFLFTAGIDLAVNDDLNSFTNPSRFNAKTGTIASGVLHTPWTSSGFTGFTIPLLSTGAMLMFVFPNTSGGKWYKRRYTNNAWGNWIEYDGTEIVP